MGYEEDEILAGILGGVAQGVGGFSQGYAASKHLTAQEEHLKKLEEMQERDREDSRRMEMISMRAYAKMIGIPFEELVPQEMLPPGYAPPQPPAPTGPEYLQGEPFVFRPTVPAGTEGGIEGNLDYNQMLVPGGLPRNVPKPWRTGG